MGAPHRLGAREWRAIQARFAAGESAGALARAFGVAENSVRRRAPRGGWPRAALAHAPQTQDDADPADDPALVPPGLPPHLRVLARDAAMAVPPAVPHHSDLARLALRSASAALMARDGLGAMRLIRAAEQIAELDRRLDWPISEYGCDPEGLEKEESARRAVQMSYVHTLALELARMLARGETLPEPFASMFDEPDGNSPET